MELTHNIILGMLGGLGLFLYGMTIAGKALQKAASVKLSNFMDKLTSNPFMSLLIGILVTAVVQSSSATTVMVVSFVNAGLMTLTQSVGIIFGANIGTTITTQIIAFNLAQYSLPAIGVGAMMVIFTKRNYFGNFVEILGNIILGFGIIFLGIEIMTESAMPLQHSESFKTFLVHICGNNFKSIMLGILISTGFTAIVHASGATVGIIIALASAGLITDLRLSIPLILGSKIGTCVNAFIASINANRDAKRVAMGHFIFNIFGAVLTLVFISEFVKIIEMSSTNISRQIANAHTAISVLTAIICFPFVKQFTKLLEKIIPRNNEDFAEKNLFDFKLLKTPTMAISSVRNAILNMGDLCRIMLNKSFDGLVNNNYFSIRDIRTLEECVDNLQEKISKFIMEISNNGELSGIQGIELNAYREVVNDFERIADHVENIIDNTIYTRNEKKNLTPQDVATIVELKTYIKEEFEKVYIAFSNLSRPEAEVLLKNKPDIKKMYRNKLLSLNRSIKDGTIDPVTGMIIIDIVYNLQKISYHLRRILYSILRIDDQYEEQYEEDDDYIKYNGPIE